MSNIKTVVLNGTELKVEGLGGQNTAIINKSGGTVYASVNPNIVPEGDNVIEIAAGDRDGLYNTNGTLYLLGTGKVELRGTDYAINFRKPSRSADGGGETPTADTMPYMDGIFGCFSNESIDENKWRNLLLPADFITLSHVSAEDNSARFIAAVDCYGKYIHMPPAMIYLMVRSAEISNNKTFGSVILRIGSSFKIMNLNQENGGGFGYSGSGTGDIVVNPAPKPSTEYQIVALKINENQIVFFIDGENVGSTGARNISSESMITLAGNSSGVDSHGDYFMRFCAFGNEPHTDEQIKANSEWILNPYLGGDCYGGKKIN